MTYQDLHLEVSYQETVFPHHLGRESQPEVDCYSVLDAAEVSSMNRTEEGNRLELWKGNQNWSKMIVNKEKEETFSHQNVFPILSTEIIHTHSIYICIYIVSDCSFYVTQCTYTEKNGKSILTDD